METRKPCSNTNPNSFSHPTVVIRPPATVHRDAFFHHQRRALRCLDQAHRGARAVPCPASHTSQQDARVLAVWLIAAGASRAKKTPLTWTSIRRWFLPGTWGATPVMLVAVAWSLGSSDTAVQFVMGWCAPVGCTVTIGCGPPRAYRECGRKHKGLWPVCRCTCCARNSE